MPRRRETVSLEGLGACALQGIKAQETAILELFEEGRAHQERAAAVMRRAMELRNDWMRALSLDLDLDLPTDAAMRVCGVALEVVWNDGPAELQPRTDEPEPEALPADLAHAAEG